MMTTPKISSLGTTALLLEAPGPAVLNLSSASGLWRAALGNGLRSGRQCPA